MFNRSTVEVIQLELVHIFISIFVTSQKKTTKLDLLFWNCFLSTESGHVLTFLSAHIAE